MTSAHTSAPHPRPRSRRVVGLLAGVATAVAAGTLWYASETAEGGAISQLPAAERKALFQRTLRTLSTTCAPSTKPSGLDPFCHEQAEFIVQFPECDDACRAAANPHRGPAR